MTGAAPHGAPRVAASLYARYFAPADMNAAGMSSHWRAFAPRSSVRVDASGVPVDAVGAGFGDMNVRRRGNAVFTPLAAVLHTAAHPVKRRVPAAIAATWRASFRAGLVFNQDALRQAFTLALIAGHLQHERIQRIVMIGDGYGLLGAALARWRPAAQLVFVDLGRSLLFQALTCGRVFPDAEHVLLGGDGAPQAGSSRFVYCPADRLEHWPPGPIDLAVNVASMQEMTGDAVAAYFALLRRAPTSWFYCCNRAIKRMPEGEVSAFTAYPWTQGDAHVVDGACPWHQWYVRPRRAGTFGVSIRTPYDGTHLHRLTRLAPAASGAA